MSTLLRVLVMTLDATGTVSFWESSPPSQSISDARSVIEHAEEWKGSPELGKALAVVVMATGHRPRLIPFAGCSESAQRAWNFGRWLLRSPGPALLLPEGLAGATML
jgi:hypothetical protein